MKELALSSQAKHLPLTYPLLRRELVTSDPYAAYYLVDPSQYTGLHFWTKNKVNYFKRLMIMMENAGKKDLSYVTIHLEELPSDREETIKLLTELNQKAQKHNLQLLLENVTPRFDRKLEPWQYSVIEFMKAYKTKLKDLTNIGFCLDISHLMEAEPAVMTVIAKVFEARLTATNLEKVLTEEELILWDNLQKVLSRTKTIHFSRAKETKSVTDKNLYKFFAGLMPVLPKKLKDKLSGRFHHAYSFLENILNAHYSVISDPDLFVMMTELLNQLNWQGTVVIESPDFLILLRERKRPFESEVAALKEIMIRQPKEKYLRKIFEAAGISGKEVDDLLDFSFLQMPSERFFPLLESCFLLLTFFYRDSDGNLFRRKVNEGLYLRHVLKTAVLADIYFDKLKRLGLVEDKDYKRVILSSLFHDVLELKLITLHTDLMLKDKIKQAGIDDEIVDSIWQDIGLLTPKNKPPGLSYEARKEADFQPLVEAYKNGNRIPLLVKAFDILANIEETIEDCKKGLEPNGKMKPLEDRYQVFSKRIFALYQLMGENVLTERLMDKLEMLFSLRQEGFD